MKELLDGHFFKIPDDIYRAVKNVYELAVLTHLLQRQNGDGCSFPSLETLAQDIMSTRQVSRATKSLAERGIITIDKKWVFCGGIRIIYTVKMDVILATLEQTASRVDCQSSGLPVATLQDPQSVREETVSPHNHTHGNQTHLTKPNKTTTTVVVPEKIKKIYKENIGRVSGVIAENLSLAAKQYPENWIVDAIREAAGHNVLKWSYVQGILENWHKNGRSSTRKEEPVKKFVEDKW